jgi:hypothetical protein
VVELELIPDPGRGSRAARVAAAALAREGLDRDDRDDVQAMGLRGAPWRRAAVEEAVERGDAFGGRRGRSAYVPRARSTRGATRA